MSFTSFIRKTTLWKILIPASFVFSGCASLQSVSMTQVPKDRNHRIEQTVSNWAFLGIHFSNDFVDEAIQKLQDQCPHGRITGIYTKYERYYYFIVGKRVLTASGYCEIPKTKTASTDYEKNKTTL